ncbi:MAG: Ada metal-binding domain-containing protein [Halobacteriota archaeon]
MRRQFLSLFLTLLILISVGGVVSIVGAASHATHGQITKLDSKADSCLFIANPRTGVYHYANCSHWKKEIGYGHGVCFNNPCDAVAAGYRPCLVCNPPGCHSK